MSSEIGGQGPISRVEKRAVKALRRHGIAMIPFSALIDDAGLWTELRAEAGAFVTSAEEALRARYGDRPAGQRAGRRGTKREARRARRGEQADQRKTKKYDFILRSSEIHSSSPPDALLRYALSDQLLGISNAYLGLKAKLAYADMWFTAPSPEDQNRVKSQRWHRDHIDPHIVKVFTYFADVDAASGALEYIRGSADGGPYGELWPWSEGDHYPPDGELERRVPAAARVSAEGPAGTVVLCDTGGFHRGGFARRPRITANFTYASPDSAAVKRVEAGDRVRAGLSPAALFALE